MDARVKPRHDGCGRKRMNATRLAVAAAFLALVTLSGAGAQPDAAESYPNRPIRIVVGFTPGGGNDILARLVGQKMSERFGQPVVIENKPGAGAIIGTEYVKNQAPDGHTLLVGASGAMTINPAIYARLPYNTQRDFVPISMMASFPLILIVPPAAPANSVAELVAYAKANPDKANYASSSAAFQLATELFKLRTGAPAQHIPYKGSGDSLAAVVSGEVLMSIIDTGPAAGQIKGGQVRALAVTSARRSAEFPDIPTLAEAGVADMEVVLWSGLLAPAGTPPAIVRKLQDAVARIVRLPDIQERMKTLALEPVGNTSEEFARIIAADIERWTTVAKAGNIKIEQ
jgi:tripartite-type tricarboxylate transporter receptor subunit TctC